MVIAQVTPDSAEVAAIMLRVKQQHLCHLGNAQVTTASGQVTAMMLRVGQQ